MAAATAITKPATEEAPVGPVFLTFAIRNAFDMGLAERGRASTADIREVQLPDVLMDTGATLLCLPARIVAELGLTFDREVAVATPTGTATLRIFRDARVEYEDRAAFVGVIELPNEARPLLGAIPMEELGIEPDLQNRRVRKFPMNLQSSFMRV